MTSWTQPLSTPVENRHPAKTVVAAILYASVLGTSRLLPRGHAIFTRKMAAKLILSHILQTYYSSTRRLQVYYAPLTFCVKLNRLPAGNRPENTVFVCCFKLNFYVFVEDTTVDIVHVIYKVFCSSKTIQASGRKLSLEC